MITSLLSSALLAATAASAAPTPSAAASDACVARKAMPTFHKQPMAAMEGLKGCGGCHTRHTFSKRDAARPLRDPRALPRDARAGRDGEKGPEARREVLRRHPWTPSTC
jgi:cytochrome c553